MALVLGDAARHDCHFVGSQFPAVRPLRARCGCGMMLALLGRGSAMGFRFLRSFRLLPGIRLNLSKSGISASLGIRDAHVTVGPRGTTTSVGLPGTGLSYTSRVQDKAPEKYMTIREATYCLRPRREVGDSAGLGKAAARSAVHGEIAGPA